MIGPNTHHGQRRDRSWHKGYKDRVAPRDPQSVLSLQGPCPGLHRIILARGLQMGGKAGPVQEFHEEVRAGETLEEPFLFNEPDPISPDVQLFPHLIDTVTGKGAPGLSQVR